MRRRERDRYPFAMATALALTAWLALVAQAQAMVHFEMPAQPLADSLRAVGSQANINILFDPPLVAGRRAPPLKAYLTPDQALTQLLAGTGIKHEFMNETTVVLAREEQTGTAPRESITSSSQNQSAGGEDEGVNKKEGKRSSSDGFRMAQAAQGQKSGTPQLTGESDTTSQQKAVVLQEVIVTAQKRSELLSKTPLAVSALNMTQLQDAGVVSVTGLASSVPDVQVHTQGIDLYYGITIRGISNYDYSGTSDPAVSIYVDGIYVGVPQGFTSELYDLERVEVLRGPQGTLYGRNATGGNVNFQTADPKSDFSASASVSYGNYNDVQTQGTVNVPVTDGLDIRAAFMTHRNNGYFDTRGYTAQNYGVSDDFGGRLTALWVPVESIKWRLSFDYFQNQGTPPSSIQTRPDGDPVNGLSPYKQPTSSDPEPYVHLTSTAVRSRVDWSIAAPVTVSYVAGYQDLRFAYAWATTGGFADPASPAFAQAFNEKVYSRFHELDVTYDSGPLKNVLGGTYSRQVGPTNEPFQASGTDFPGVFRAYGIYYGGTQGDPGVRKTAWGVFDQATLSLTDRLRLTGGVRYSDETQFENSTDAFGCFISAYPGLTLLRVGTLSANLPGCFPSPSPSGSGSWSKVSWKGALDADINPDTLGYLSVTTGFKSGGLQISAPPGVPRTFLPETVTNYEIGVKTHLFHESANLRAALFYEDYKDIQVAQLIAASTGPYLDTSNAGKARIYGAELEGEWSPSPRDHVRGFANYLHAAYTDYTDAEDPLTLAKGLTLDGNELPNAPRVSLRLEYSHEFSLGSKGTLTPQAAVYWQSSSFLSAFEDPSYRVGAYSKTDANLTYTDSSGHWKVSAFGYNLENNAVRTGQFTGTDVTFHGAVYSDFAPPRIYGLRVSYQP